MTRRLAIATALVGVLLALAPAGAQASHFRYGNLNWQKAGPTVSGATPVTFQSEQSWRASSFGTPAVGSVITNDEGCIAFGDGTTDVCPMYRVTFVNADEDYLIMHALAPGSMTDRNIPHTYTAPGPFAATTESCCTISTLNNAADASWQVSSLVDLSADDESPKASVPPIVQLPEGGVQRYTVPAVDAGGETRRFRLTTAEESCLGCADPHPPGLTIDPSSGQVSWDTTGRNTGIGLWWTGVVVEALVGGQVVSSTQIDYIIRVGGTGSNDPPAWDDAVTPADGAVFPAQPGDQVSFALRAPDPNAGDTVQIFQNSGPGTFSANAGNPATGTFAYTAQAADVGNDLIVQFLAQDDGSPPSGPPFRSFILRVRAAPATLEVTTSDQGTTRTVTATLRDGSGQPVPGARIVVSVTGANPRGATTLTTDGAGVATLSYDAGAAGQDTIEACYDANRDGACGGGEISRSVSAGSADAQGGAGATAALAPGLVSALPDDRDADGIADGEDTNDASTGPTLAETVVARVVSGEVFYRVPSAGGPRPRTQARASQAARGAVPLKGAGIIPVGSVVDTASGRVAITSSAGSGASATQTADFYDGIFQIRQARARNAVTELRLRSPSATPFNRVCGRAARSARGGRAVASQRSSRVVSRLWGDGRGRYRTRGRHSAATVRGTVWLTEQRCDGTLTRVRAGVVTVQDLGDSDTTVDVRAGESYLARARRATIRRR